MNDNLTQKMLKYFGNEGCIMFSHSCNFYKLNLVTKKEILEYNKMIISQKNLQIPFLNHLSCCLYYLTNVNSKNVKEQFTQNVILEFSKKKEINDDNLILLYNIIDYYNKFFDSNDEKLNFLLKKLELFSNIKKSFENFLLYKYYRSILLYNLKRYDDYYKEYLELIMSFSENGNNLSKYSEFIRLKNDLFKLKTEKNLRTEPNEQLVFLEDIYKRVKIYNKSLTVNIGFDICNNLCEQGKYDNCFKYLEELDEILKHTSDQKKGIILRLGVYSRAGFYGTLSNNSKEIDSAISKLNDGILGIKQDLNQKKIKSLFIAFTFALTMIKLNHNVEVDRIKEIAHTFKKEFFSNNDDNFNKFIINYNNRNICTIDIFGCNNSDIEILTEMKGIINPQIEKINSGEVLNSNSILPFIIGVNNLINLLTEDYCKEENKEKQEEYQNKCLAISEKVINYYNSNYSTQFLLKIELAKKALIQIYSTYMQFYLNKKDIHKVKNSLNSFDDLAIKLGINSQTTNIELISKIKGDYSYLIKDFNSAISFYSEAIKKMNDKNPKKPVLFFNLGICFYYSFNKTYAIEFLNKSIGYFKSIENRNVMLDFYKRPKIIEKKIKIAEYLLGIINKN